MTVLMVGNPQAILYIWKNKVHCICLEIGGSMPSNFEVKHIFGG
jgi:hypothetical protein